MANLQKMLADKIDRLPDDLKTAANEHIKKNGDLSDCSPLWLLWALKKLTRINYALNHVQSLFMDMSLSLV